MELKGDVRRAVELALAAAADLKVDFAEIYIETGAQDEIRFDNERVEQARVGSELGVGIRLIKHERISYSLANSLDPAVLRPLVREAAAGLQLGLGASGAATLRSPTTTTASDAVSAINLPGLDYDLIAHEMAQIDRHARASSPWVRQVAVQFLSQRRHVVIANSEGLFKDELRQFTRVNVQAVAGRNNVVRSSADNAALTVSEAALFDRYPAATLGRQAGMLAELMLDAVPAPTGPLPVVVANGRGGALIHEACVHCLEGDFIARENSVYSGRLGEAVAGQMVTVIDDGTIAAQTGSSLMDDEGTATQRNVLIEKGRLRSYLADRTHALRLRHPFTGSGRRQSYAHLPIPRMTNTFIAPGEDTTAEIIATTPYGVYARQVLGGEVNPITGQFVFTVADGYLIENGRLTRPLIPFTLTGNGPEVLRNIDRVAHDFELAAALCGKNGQFVPVSVGQPTIRVKELVVGGTAR